MGHASDQWCITMVSGFPSPHINGVYSICNWYHPLSYPCRTMFTTILSNSIQYYPRSFTSSQARFPGRGSGEEVLKSRLPSQVPKQGSQWFPGRGSQRFPKIPKGSQEQVPKQGYQARRFPRKGFQAKVPRTGCQASFPSKLTKQGYQARVPKQGSQEKVARVPRTGCQARVPKTGFQAMFPRTGSQAR